MSWLEEDEREFLFTCPEGHTQVITAAAKDAPGPGDWVMCPDCEKQAHYSGLVPIQLKSTTAIEGEQNGRKYVEYKDGNGRVRRISKTKLEYLRTGKSTESVLANDYKRHLERSQVQSASKEALKE